MVFENPDTYTVAWNRNLGKELRENLKVLDVTLTNDEMAAISALARPSQAVHQSWTCEPPQSF